MQKRPSFFWIVAVGVVLLGLMLPTYNYFCCYRNAQVRARHSLVLSNLRAWSLTLTKFYNINGYYPGYISPEARGRGVKNDLSERYFSDGDRILLLNAVKQAGVNWLDEATDPFRNARNSPYQYCTDGKTFFLITSYGPDNESDMCEDLYTGALPEDGETKAWRGAAYPFRGYSYDNSNGTFSRGDIFTIVQPE